MARPSQMSCRTFAINNRKLTKRMKRAFADTTPDDAGPRGGRWRGPTFCLEAATEARRYEQGSGGRGAGVCGEGGPGRGYPWNSSRNLSGHE